MFSEYVSPTHWLKWSSSWLCSLLSYFKQSPPSPSSLQEVLAVLEESTKDWLSVASAYFGHEHILICYVIGIFLVCHCQTDYKVWNILEVEVSYDMDIRHLAQSHVTKNMIPNPEHLKSILENKTIWADIYWLTLSDNNSRTSVCISECAAVDLHYASIIERLRAITRV